MTLDKTIRTTLRNAVTRCRRLLEDSVGDVLEGQFGIHRDGRVEDEAAMRHLSPELLADRGQVLSHLDHIRARGFKPDAATAQLIREAAYTHLNRLCAYKMLEQRRLIREAVGRGQNSTGFKFYLAQHPEDEQLWSTGQQDLAYRHFLEWLGETLSAEIGVLFSSTDPANRLFPPQRVLDQVLALINADELHDVWAEEETIGWIYQYYTPKELRDQARKESGAPRNSYELAFRNQFYTPRYVVEFLTDNTLGRLWYEMRQGQTTLAEQCRYLVRRPDEVFLASSDGRDRQDPDAAFLRGDADDIAPFAAPTDEGQQAQAEHRLIRFAHAVRPFAWSDDPRMPGWREMLEQLSTGEPEEPVEGRTQDLWDLLLAVVRADRFNEGTLTAHTLALTRVANEIRRRLLVARNADDSSEQRLRAPHLIAYRAPKDPRELAVLDPACGSCHFLLYGFDLLQTIYDGAYDDPDLGEPLRRDYPDREAFRRAVPGLILRHNLYGIDIDLRATQIAALALWLRAQRAYQEMGLSRAECPRITRTNIVCAEPMPGEQDLLDEFAATLQPPLIGELVKLIFDRMQLAGEAGSLLKIDVELDDAIARAKRQWQQEFERARDRRGNEMLFTRAEMDRLSGKDGTQLGLFDVSQITDEQFWDQVVGLVLEALRTYAVAAANGREYQRKLFAEDAEQGFAFIEVCRERFEVVLMNPPFGLPTPFVEEWAKSAYPDTWQDIYAMFIDRALSLVASEKGTAGAITPKSYYHAKGFRGLRHLVRTPPNQLTYSVDIGSGVLDAAVEICLSLITTDSPKSYARTTSILNLVGEPQETVAESVQQRLDDHGKGVFDKRWVLVDLSASKDLPNEMLPYRFPSEIVEVFSRFPSFESEHGKSVVGITTFDNERFIRCRWEVSAASIQDGDWKTVAMGGGWAPFYDELNLVVNWRNDAEEMRANELARYGTTARTTQSKRYWFKPGLTFSKVSTLGFSVQPFPADSVFTSVGFCIFSNNFDLWTWLGYFNSRPVASLMSLYSADRHWHSNSVGSLPVPNLAIDGLPELAQKAYEAAAGLGLGSETAPEFVSSEQTGTELDDSSYASATAQLNHLVADALGLSAVALEFLADNAIYKERFLNTDEESLARDRLAYALGCAVGRWDVRLTLDVSLTPKRTHPFAPLPVCPPGMLIGPDGLPAHWSFIASEEWLRARPDAVTLPPIGSVRNTTISDSEYPIVIDWDGILVDDPDDPSDIVRRVSEVLHLQWNDGADCVKAGMCEVLGVKNLREYFRNPRHFFESHVRRYSQSRRKAPIYWLLQSPKRNYAIWLYYHRLDPDILFKALMNYAEPKLRLEEDRLRELQSRRQAGSAAGSEERRLEKIIDQQEALLSDLHEFRDRLDRAARLHLQPDLNDGVILNIAPLWELVPWKEASRMWNELLAGKYEWSSIGKQLREKGLV